jgi:hypothetical protein
MNLPKCANVILDFRNLQNVHSLNCCTGWQGLKSAPTDIIWEEIKL